MNAATQKTCLEILSAMLSPSQTWNDAAASLYSIAMHGWSDDIALRTVRHVAMTQKWRPAPSELREQAARIVVADMAPVPDPSAIREEIRRLMIWHGKDSAKAKHLHPIVPLVAAELGDWLAISRMYTDDLDKEFPAAYQRAVEAFYRHVADTQLTRLEADRKLQVPAIEGVTGGVTGEAGLAAAAVVPGRNGTTCGLAKAL